MSERQGFTGGQILIAAAAGALVGAAAALLLAPKSGAELRSRIKDLAAAGRDRINRVPRVVGDAAEAARDAFVTTLDRS